MNIDTAAALPLAATCAPDRHVTCNMSITSAQGRCCKLSLCERGQAFFALRCAPCPPPAESARRGQCWHWACSQAGVRTWQLVFRSLVPAGACQRRTCTHVLTCAIIGPANAGPEVRSASTTGWHARLRSRRRGLVTVLPVCLFLPPTPVQQKDVPPSPAYMGMVIEGAEDAGLDNDYLQFLRAIPTDDTVACLGNCFLPFVLSPFFSSFSCQRATY